MKKDSNALLQFQARNRHDTITEEKVYFVNGVEFGTISYIMSKMQCSRSTIADWERKGLEEAQFSTRKLKLFPMDDLISWYKANTDVKQSKRTNKNISVNIGVEEEEDEDSEENTDLDKVTKQEAERRKEIEAVKKLMMQNKILNGENISIDDVDKNLATQAATHISHLSNSEKILPNLLENKSASDIQDILNEHNQMQIEQLYRITNKELTGEHELFDVFMKVINKIDDGVSVEVILEGVDKIVVS